MERKKEEEEEEEKKKKKKKKKKKEMEMEEVEATKQAEQDEEEVAAEGSRMGAFPCCASDGIRRNGRIRSETDSTLTMSESRSPRERRSDKSRWSSRRRSSPSRSRSRSRSETRDRIKTRRTRSRSKSRSPSLPKARRDRVARSNSPPVPRRSRVRSRSRSCSGGREHTAKANETKKAKDYSHLVQWGKQEDKDEDDTTPDEPVQKPDFGLSGALAKDKTTGNVQNGVVLKWSEPPEARKPTRKWRLYVFKNDEMIATLHVHRKSAFLAGRDKTIADVLTEHASCSKQHAVLQFRLFQREVQAKDGSFRAVQEVRPYILDLNSTNGTFLNGKRIDSARYIELKPRDVLKFGESTREYVLMDAS